MKMKKILIIAYFFTSFAYGQDFGFHKKAFPFLTKVEQVKIDDPISEFKTNLKMFEALDSKGKRIGFFRDIATSTGCNDGCLPVIFTLFYDRKGKFLKVLSKVGLTKKDHADFNEFDYIRLESILRENPEVFKKVKHPTEMVDAITRATTKEYQPHVVKKAAYTSLRINLYNQHTLEFLKKTYFSAE